MGAPCLVGREGVTHFSQPSSLSLALAQPLLPSSHVGEHLLVAPSCQNLPQPQASAHAPSRSLQGVPTRGHGAGSFSPAQGSPLTGLRLFPFTLHPITLLDSRHSPV